VYSTSGAGPPLLFDSGWVSHLRGQLEMYGFGSFVERLAERFTVIRYDKPGCGLSDRDGIDLSFDGQLAAALAVADAVGAGRFGLFGASQGGQLAAAIAARYPDRVDQLVLYGMRQRQRSGACRDPGLGRGVGAGPLGPGAEGAGRGVRHRPHRR
jgi:pimeloyl-ACP methyl ester carboxylesterase